MQHQACSSAFCTGVHSPTLQRLRSQQRRECASSQSNLAHKIYRRSSVTDDGCAQAAIAVAAVGVTEAAVGAKHLECHGAGGEGGIPRKRASAWLTIAARWALMCPWKARCHTNHGMPSCAMNAVVAALIEQPQQTLPQDTVKTTPVERPLEPKKRKRLPWWLSGNIVEWIEDAKKARPLPHTKIILNNVRRKRKR